MKFVYLLLLIIMSWGSCIPHAVPISKDEIRVVRGTIGYRWQSPQRLFSGTAAVAISNNGLVQIQVLDLAGNALFHCQIDHSKLKLMDLGDACWIEQKRIERATTKIFGFAMNAQWFWEALGEEPWLEASKRWVREIDPDKNIEVDYIATNEESENQRLIIRSKKQGWNFEIKWINKTLSDDTTVQSAAVFLRYPECADRKMKDLLKEY